MMHTRTKPMMTRVAYYARMFSAANVTPTELYLDIRKEDRLVALKRYLILYTYMLEHGHSRLGLCTMSRHSSSYLITMDSTSIQMWHSDGVNGTIWKVERPSEWTSMANSFVTNIDGMSHKDFVAEFFEFVHDYMDA